MLQDVEHGKPIEIDALLTVPHDIGQMVGVPTPFIDSVLGLARRPSSSHAQGVRLLPPCPKVPASPPFSAFDAI